ncbi:hypothetical protein EYF80_065902 [Liparis tanakae]|uniref:Uncharacterized protein n=1 Tax=Liparis tanakae TaxID=230148 RepID=A0A4Z2E5U1_9TELE|nr:hypothetical protein EYF80_065902 [Liparis tanakae]
MIHSGNLLLSGPRARSGSGPSIARSGSGPSIARRCVCGPGPAPGGPAKGFWTGGHRNQSRRTCPDKSRRDAQSGFFLSAAPQEHFRPDARTLVRGNVATRRGVTCAAREARRAMYD